MSRTVWVWIFAILITLASVVYQRLTGPSYPVRASKTLPSGETIKCRLLTSHESGSDAGVVIPVIDKSFSGEVSWRRINSRDEWLQIPLERHGDSLIAFIPRQPAAGKVAYSITLVGSNSENIQVTEKPVVVRFKDHVPVGVLAPHIAFMFFSMLLACRTGIEALMKRSRALTLAIWTTALLLIGGLILGPIVQKFAFGAYWTGWPVGSDLTDNKTALAMLLWVISIWRSARKKNVRWWFVAAASVHLLVYLIPHSVLGSELDYSAAGN